MRAALKLAGTRQGTGFTGGEDAGRIDYGRLRPRDVWALRVAIGEALSQAHPAPKASSSSSAPRAATRTTCRRRISGGAMIAERSVCTRRRSARHHSVKFATGRVMSFAAARCEIASAI